MYLETKINGRNVSCLIDTGATHSSMSRNIVKELDLPTSRVGKPINMWFVKGELYETKDVAMNVNLKCSTFEFKENFTLCEIDELDLIQMDIFFKTYTVDVMRKPIWCANLS